MKSLILKDLYNIGHNAKSMLFILLFFAVVFLPSSGIPGYIYTCTILCGTMIVTTFSFDERSNWTPYALIMPVSGKELIAGKYITLFIFSATGVLFGLAAGTAGSFIHGAFASMPETVPDMTVPLAAVTALAFSNVLGGISIPLVLRFGTEKSRILILASIFIPVAVCYMVYRLLTLPGIAITDASLTALLYASPAIALIWNYLMFQISCRILSKKEF